MAEPFTPLHRGGAGPPIVLLHGFIDTWRTWELVLPALERRHDVLAPTLAGHAGGPPLGDEISDRTVADAVEAAMDEAGFETADIVGNSLGGFVSLQLAARGRARSVVALAPAGGWAPDDVAFAQLIGAQSQLLGMMKAAAPHAEALLATPAGRRQATQLTAANFEHIPTDLLVHQLVAAAAAPGAARMLEYAAEAEFSLDAEAIECPVRVVWGTDDPLLAWPSAAVRFREEWVPNADWVTLEGVRHCPQLDVPLETAELVLGWTGG